MGLSAAVFGLLEKEDRPRLCFPVLGWIGIGAALLVAFL